MPRPKSVMRARACVSRMVSLCGGHGSTCMQCLLLCVVYWSLLIYSGMCMLGAVYLCVITKHQARKCVRIWRVCVGVGVGAVGFAVPTSTVYTMLPVCMGTVLSVVFHVPGRMSELANRQRTVSLIQKVGRILLNSFQIKLDMVQMNTEWTTSQACFCR